MYIHYQCIRVESGIAYISGYALSVVCVRVTCAQWMQMVGCTQGDVLHQCVCACECVCSMYHYRTACTLYSGCVGGYLMHVHTGGECVMCTSGYAPSVVVDAGADVHAIGPTRMQKATCPKPPNIRSIFTPWEITRIGILGNA